MASQERRFTAEREGDSLVHVSWSAAIVLDETDARSLTVELTRALPGRRAHLLMSLNGMAALDQDALAHFAKRVPLSAVALVGPSVLDEPLIELYYEIYRPPFPVGYFELEPAARAWLVRQPALA